MGGWGSKEESPPRSSSTSSSRKPPPPPQPKGPLSTPWRETGKKGLPMEWNEETESALRDTCLKTNLGLKKKQRVKILMLGATGSGKSSFVNSLYDALKDKVNQWTYSAASSTTVTKTLYSPPLKINGKKPWFKLLDAPGILETDEAFYTDFVTMALDGHIKEKVEIPPGRIQKDLDYYVPKPGALDGPCLVVFVVKAGGYVPDSVLKRKFDIVKARAGVNKIKIAVVLTKADVLSQGEMYPLKGKDMKFLYRSEAARKAVQIASSETGLPQNQIFPITNYTEQTETCTEMNIAILYTLSKLLNFAELEAESRIGDDSDDDDDDDDDD